MNLAVECEREDDGRWLAEVVGIPGALAYATTRSDAMARAEALALRVLADRIEQGDLGATPLSIVLPVP